MAEKWRVVIVLDGAADAWLWPCKRDLAREMRDRTGVVVVGVPDSAPEAGWRNPDESSISGYTDNRGAAEAAARIAQEVTGQHGLSARVSVECWRPVSKGWEDASAISARDLAEERDWQEREDRRLLAETGIAQWRVRVELRTHRDTVALAQRLSGEGHHVDQKWKSLTASAGTEDDANWLAERAKQYAPSNAEIHAERADTPIYAGDDWAAGPLDFPGL